MHWNDVVNVAWSVAIGHLMMRRQDRPCGSGKLRGVEPVGQRPRRLDHLIRPARQELPVPGSACTLPSRIATRPPFTVATGQPVTSIPSYGV